jgi:hypothetical protein
VYSPSVSSQSTGSFSLKEIGTQSDVSLRLVSGGTRLNPNEPWPMPRIAAKRTYLHGFPWLDAHHFHREAPPDQQDAGRSLTLEVDAAGSGYDPSATFGPSTTFGLERESENSLGSRGEPFAVPASPAPLGARSALAGGLTSASMRRSAGGLGGKALFAALSRLRCAGARFGMSPATG